MKVSDIQQPDNRGRQVLKIEGVNCILPLGMNAVDMSKGIERIVGTLCPAITFNQTIHINNDVQQWLSIETIVHECMHGFQERKMGRLSYWATYLWHIVLTIIKDGTFSSAHIHQDHMMEIEARDVGKTVVASFDRTKDLDIATEIFKIKEVIL
jgi:hypothetical protein